MQQTFYTDITHAGVKQYLLQYQTIMSFSVKTVPVYCKQLSQFEEQYLTGNLAGHAPY